VAFAQDEDMIQTLAPDRANEPFREGVLPTVWRARSVLHRFPCPSRVAGTRDRRSGPDRGGDRLAQNKVLTTCWAVQVVVGCSVTLKWRTRRRWWASTTRTKRTRSCAVGTVKKSTATRSRTWLVRNVRQVWEGGERRLGISRETVRSATSMPSFMSSPWIRGAPHKGVLSRPLL
jgi:hypothetical protein